MAKKRRGNRGLPGQAFEARYNAEIAHALKRLGLRSEDEAVAEWHLYDIPDTVEAESCDSARLMRALLGRELVARIDALGCLSVLVSDWREGQDPEVIDEQVRDLREALRHAAPNAPDVVARAVERKLKKEAAAAERAAETEEQDAEAA